MNIDYFDATLTNADASRWNNAVDIHGHLRKEKMLKRQIDSDPVPSKAPGAGMILVAKRRITCGGEVYNCGAPIEPAALGKNLDAMLAGHFVGWIVAPADVTLMPKPIAVAKPAPAQMPNPAVEIVADADVVQSWRLTLSKMTGKLGGDKLRATDLILKDERGAELFERAQRVHYQRQTGGARKPLFAVSAL